MSAGITPSDFVQQVFYMQEKVLLTFYPTDDKYQEVIMDGNFVLEELQKEEDWLWLRNTMPLGLTTKPTIDTTAIQSFTFDTSEVYKLSTLFGDCVHLYAHREIPDELDDDETLLDYIIPWDEIRIPLVSAGSTQRFPKRVTNRFGIPNQPDLSLGAYVTNNKLNFTRLFMGPEIDRIVVIDYQKRITPFDKYDSATEVLTEVPDINYVVAKTAYYHAMGSPTAQGNLAALSDIAQKLLSAMRENNAAATAPDIMEYEVPGYIEVI